MIKIYLIFKSETSYLKVFTLTGTSGQGAGGFAHGYGTTHLERLKKFGGGGSEKRS